MLGCEGRRAPLTAALCAAVRSDAGVRDASVPYEPVAALSAKELRARFGVSGYQREIGTGSETGRGGPGPHAYFFTSKATQVAKLECNDGLPARVMCADISDGTVTVRMPTATRVQLEEHCSRVKEYSECETQVDEKFLYLIGMYSEVRRVRRAARAFAPHRACAQSNNEPPRRRAQVQHECEFEQLNLTLQLERELKVHYAIIVMVGASVRERYSRYLQEEVSDVCQCGVGEAHTAAAHVILLEIRDQQDPEVAFEVLRRLVSALGCPA